MLEPTSVTGRSRLSKTRSGGEVLLPEAGSTTLEMTTWNTGELDPTVVSNATHAEAQFTQWFGRQEDRWRRRVRSIDMDIRDYSPCTMCADDLQKVITIYAPWREGKATVHYREPYKLGELATTPQALSKLEGAGWKIDDKSAGRAKAPRFKASRE